MKYVISILVLVLFSTVAAQDVNVYHGGKPFRSLESIVVSKDGYVTFDKAALGSAGYGIRDNAGIIQIKSRLGARWASVVETISVTDYGATANDSGDDDATAFQDAVDALESTTEGRGTIYIPRGRFRISAWPTVTNHGITFQGAGGDKDEIHSATIIECNMTGNCLQFTNLHHPVVKDFHVVDVTENAGTVGMEFKGVHNGGCERVYFSSFDGGGIRLTTSSASSTIYNEFENCQALTHTNAGGTAFGLEMSEPDVTKAVNQNVFRQFHAGNSDVCVDMKDTPNENVFIGIECGGSTDGMIVRGRNTTIIGGTLEGMSGTALNVPSGASTASVTIIGTIFQGNGVDINNPDGRPICQLGTTVGGEAIDCDGGIEVTTGLGLGGAAPGTNIINFASGSPSATIQVAGTSVIGLVGTGTPRVIAYKPVDVENKGARIYAGTGSPEAVITANVGSLFMRTDGGAATSLYVKESGAGNTGWIAK